MTVSNSSQITNTSVDRLISLPAIDQMDSRTSVPSPLKSAGLRFRPHFFSSYDGQQPKGEMMSTLELPGPVVEAHKSDSDWIVFFQNVPWPSVFPANNVELANEKAFSALWWDKHQMLREPSPLLRKLLSQLKPYQNYTAGEVLKTFIRAGYPFDSLADEQIVERLQLMPRWNGWHSQRHPGFFWAYGKHHEVQQEERRHVS